MARRIVASSRCLVVFVLIAFALVGGAFAADGADELALALPGARPVAQTQESAIRSMSGKQLRRFLQDRSARCDGCIEKAHLVERALDVRTWSTADELVAAQLSPSAASAATHLSLHHISTPDLPPGTIAFVDEPIQSEAIRNHQGDVVVDDKYVCNQPTVNGSSFCHSIAGMQKHARAAMA